MEGEQEQRPDHDQENGGDFDEGPTQLGLGPRSPRPPPSTPTPLARVALQQVAAPQSAVDVEELDDADLVEDEDDEDASRPMRPPAPPSTPADRHRAGVELPPPLPEPDLALEMPTALERLIEKGADSPAVRAEWYAHQLEEALSAGDNRRAALFGYELGELLEFSLGDEGGAVKAYGRVLQVDPTLRANLWSIRRVFYRRQLWPNLIKLIAAEVRFAKSDAAAAELLIERAQILEERLGSPNEARACYEQALARDQAALPAWFGLERLALAAGDTALLARALRGLADCATHPERRVCYLIDLARLCARDHGDLAQARAALAEASELGVQSARVTREREALAERTGDLEELLDALEAQIAQLLARLGATGLRGGEHGSGTDARAVDLRRRAVALRRRQARELLQRGGEPDRAWAYLQEALALAPGEPLLLADLADIAEQQGRFEELAGLVEDWESREADPTRALGLSLRRADALLRSGRSEQARSLLSQLAASAPGYLPVIALREREALGRRDIGELASIFCSAAEAAQSGSSFGINSPVPPDPEGAAAHYTAAGDLLAIFAGDDAGARQRYQLALSVAPSYAPAAEALISLCERTGALAEAASLCESHAGEGNQARGAQLYERLVRYYDQLERPDALLAVLERWIELEPDELSLRWRLESTLESLSRHRERLGALLDLAERLADADQRAGLLAEAARLADLELGDAEQGAELYRRVLELWPEDPYSRAALSGLFCRARRWEELCAARRREAAALKDGAAAARALREAAEVLRVHLNRPRQAAEFLREACERSPQDADALRECSAAWAEEAERTGDSAAFEELSAALEREAAITEAGPGRAHLLTALGNAEERAGRDERAIEAYRRAIENDASSSLAAVAMVELGYRRKDAAVSVEGLLHLANSAPAELSAELAEEAGWLSAIALQDPQRAAQAFDAGTGALSARPGLHFGRALVAGRLGDAARAGDALARMAETVRGDYTRASALVRAGLMAAVGRDEQAAWERLAAAAEAAPEDPGAVVAATESFSGAAPAFEGSAPAGPALRHAALCAARAHLSDDDAERVDWEYRRAASLLAAGRLRAAAEILFGLLAREPDDVRALSLMRRICVAGGDRSGLARVSSELARALGDRDSKLALLREAAAVCDRELGDVRRAVPLYRRILAEDPGAEEFSRLHEILEAHDDVGGLFELCSQRLNHASGDEPVPLLCERARLRERIGDLPGAGRDLDALLLRRPDHADGLFLQANILARLGQPQRAAALLRRFLDTASDELRRADAELILSQILAESMHDLGGAIEQLELACRARPRDGELRERLVALLLRAEDYSSAIERIRALEELRASGGERARDELRIGALFRDKVGDNERARQAFERARELEPLNVDAVRGLADLAIDEAARQRVLAGAAAELRRAIAEEPARAALYERLSAILAWRGDSEARYFALHGLAALGSATEEQRQLLASRVGAASAALVLSGKSLDETTWQQALAPAAAGGFAGELWQLIAEAVSVSLPHDPADFGFDKGDRLKWRDAERRFPMLAAAAHAFGATQSDLYVSERKRATARVTSAAEPLLCLSSDIAQADDAGARFQLGRALAHVRDRSGALADIRPSELALYFAAAAELAGAPPPEALASAAEGQTPAIAKLVERARRLGKDLGWRQRRALSGMAGRFAELCAPTTFWRAMLATGHRAGLLLAGELSAAFEILDVGPGGRSVADDPNALALVAWAVGENHLALRKRLGISA
jgi:tetratricopeptide (TPR) repeat protein